MIIFNVTAIVEEKVQKEFHHFMHHIYIPAALASHKFHDAKLFKLTEPVNEGVTYCAQCFANSKQELEDFRNEHLPNLQELLMQQFPNQVLFFPSVLELSNPL